MKNISYHYFALLFICLMLQGCDQQEKSKDADADQKTLQPKKESLSFPSDGERAHLPRLFSTATALHASWVESQDSLSILKYAVFQNDNWSRPEIIASGSDWFVNWADFPTIAVNQNTVMATFLQKSAKGTYDYDIKYSIKNGQSGQWSEPKKLHQDSIAAEHGFVSVVPYKDGFFATWLDGRNTKSLDSHGTDEMDHKGAMSLRAARIDTHGLVSQRVLLDDRVCDCCNTAATLTEDGLAVIYRDRSNASDETRDIYSTVYQKGKWSYPAPVHRDNWLINGCPVNGPAMASSNGQTVAAWFTAAQEDPRVMVAFSKNGGLHFATPTRLDAGNAIGRVAAVMKDDDHALVSWVAPVEDQTLLQLALINTDGQVEMPITISRTTAQRQSGFPQLAVVEDFAYVVWTENDGQTSDIKMARLRY